MNQLIWFYESYLMQLKKLQKIANDEEVDDEKKKIIDDIIKKSLPCRDFLMKLIIFKFNYSIV